MDSTSWKLRKQLGCKSVKKFLSHSSIAEATLESCFSTNAEVQAVSNQRGKTWKTGFFPTYDALSDGIQRNVGSKSSLLELILFELYYDDHRNDDENATPVEANWEDPSDKKKTPAKNHKYHRNVYQAKELKATLKLTEPISEIMMWTKEKKIEMIEDKLNDPDLVGRVVQHTPDHQGGKHRRSVRHVQKCSDADVEATA
jgi:hypothetical protein